MNILFRILAVGSLLMAAQTFAADAFEGKVALTMTPEKGKPMTMNYSLKGTKQRMDMDASGHQMITITDVPKMEVTVLMPEQKMYMVTQIKKALEKTIEKQGTATAEIEQTGKTENILGYKAEQFLIKDKGTTTEAWLASGLGTFMGMNRGGSPFGGAKNAAAAKWEEVVKGKSGFPLRVISRDASGKETFKMEATKIEPGPLPDSLFVPPPDFKKFDMPDMSSMGGLNPFKKN